MCCQVYHAWKAKNKKRPENGVGGGSEGGGSRPGSGSGATGAFDGETMRAPSSVMAEAARTAALGAR